MKDLTIVIPSLEIVPASTPQAMLHQISTNSSRTARVHWINNSAAHPFAEWLRGHSVVWDDNSQPNLFINPAWNYGMSKVETKYWCLLNDDVFCHGGLFDAICDMLDARGEIGLTTARTQIMYNVRDVNWWLDQNPLSVPLSWELKNPWKSGWFMIGRTDDWVPCPVGEKLDLFHGDDHIYELAFKKYGHCAMVNNNTILHAESTTTRTIHQQRDFIASISKEGKVGS